MSDSSNSDLDLDLNSGGGEDPSTFPSTSSSSRSSTTILQELENHRNVRANLGNVQANNGKGIYIEKSISLSTIFQ